MLVHEYGSLENCPKKIKGKIIEKDNTSMSESLRNRLRYLRHLPLTSIFEVCEIQLKSPFISKETLTGTFLKCLYVCLCRHPLLKDNGNLFRVSKL